MREYEVRVTSVTTVYVEAKDESEAIQKACEEALSISPDSLDAVIVGADVFDNVIEDGKNINDCPVFGKHFEELAKTIIKHEIKENKIYKTVEQECRGCGKHFRLKYCSDGNYEYIDEVCDCLATFHPVDGEPSFGEWMKQIKM